MSAQTRLEALTPEKAPRLTRLMYRWAKRRFGEVTEPFAVYAHHTRLLVANAVHEGLLQNASTTLPVSVRELAVFWTARTVGCSWCVDFGQMLMRLEGLDLDHAVADELGTGHHRAGFQFGRRLPRPLDKMSRVPWAQP